MSQQSSNASSDYYDALESYYDTDEEKEEEIIELTEPQHRDPRVFADIFLSGDNSIGSIIGPTQLGKTDSCIHIISVAMEKNIPVIISCDNKIDQLDQFYSRVHSAYAQEEFVLIKVSDTKFLDDLKSNFEDTRQIIIFCLDNSSQINKVCAAFEEIIPVLEDNTDFGPLTKVCIIHDEGDMTTKGVNVNIVEDGQSKSHRSWIEFSNMFSDNHIHLKRLFVTATPDNILIKYEDVDRIFLLPTPAPGTYKGWNNIEFNRLNPTSDRAIDDILLSEIERRKNHRESGAILLCIDRRIEDGHRFYFDRVRNLVNDDAVINTYNGEGIRAKIPSDKYRNFKRICKAYMRNDRKMKVEFDNDTYICKLDNTSISCFYAICSRSGLHIIVTIGMDLIARGISFVSDRSANEVIAATTMIYNPGKTMHAVGICQAVGRICGTARPELTRRLYAIDDIISTYRNYNLNQVQYIDLITENDYKMNSLIMDDLEFHNILVRKLDRACLKLKPKFGNGEDRVNYEQLKNKYYENNIIRSIIRFLYTRQQPVTYATLKNGISYTGTDKQFENQISHGRGSESRYGKLWNARNGRIVMTIKVRNYIRDNII